MSSTRQSRLLHKRGYTAVSKERRDLLLGEGFTLTRLVLTYGAKSHLFNWPLLQEGKHFDHVSIRAFLFLSLTLFLYT